MSANRIASGLRTLAGALLMTVLTAAPFCARLNAQTHKVAKQEDVVRAVGVYEWTGDMAKPAASRLIPVSLFINGKLEDAAVYMARPEPFALLTGNVYELQKNGIPQGTLNLQFSRHLVATEAATTTYDDGWFGYGKFFPPAPPKKSTLKGTATEISLNGMDNDSSTPRFSSRSAAPGTGAAAKPAPGTTTASTDTPATDPDRPVMRRHSDSSDSTAGSGSGPGDTPADDPDRPTLRRRSSAPATDAKGDQAEVSSVKNSLNDDPNRPLLHRGKPEGALKDDDIPKLSGLPGDLDLHQLVAVSDAADHPPHDFSRAWDDEDEHQAILAKMQTAAHAALAAYEAANGTTPAQPAAPAPSPAHAATTASRTHRPAAKAPPAPLPEPLLDEKLMGYTLSYGGAATYVYFAHTDGLGAQQKFVTLVAQVNMQGEPEIALKNVTDAIHLDRTPRMRLVDVVDAEASNRASLLFELREQNSRQFALYRVIGAQATQTFVTGTTQ
jgi:hypothetical protein